MRVRQHPSNTSSFPTILLQKTTKPMPMPLLHQNSYHMLSKSIKSKRNQLYNENFQKQKKMTNRIFALWKSSRENHQVSKKDFIKQNKKMVANLNNMNQIKELDYFSRKVLFDNYLKTYLRPGLSEKQKMNMFSNYMRAQGKQEQSDLFLDSCNRKKRRKIRRRDLSVKTNIREKKNAALRNPLTAKNRSLPKRKLRSFTIGKGKLKNKKKAKSTRLLKVKTSKSQGFTPKSRKNKNLEISPFNLKFKKINFDKTDIFEGQGTARTMGKGNRACEEEFEYLVANSFKNSKKIKTIDRLENIMEGKVSDSLDLHRLDTRNPVVLNCDLKKVLNFYKDKLRALKTKSNYIEKHILSFGVGNSEIYCSMET